MSPTKQARGDSGKVININNQKKKKSFTGLRMEVMHWHFFIMIYINTNQKINSTYIYNNIYVVFVVYMYIYIYIYIYVNLILYFFSNWDGAPLGVGALRKLRTLRIGSGGTDVNSNIVSVSEELDQVSRTE